MRKKIILFFIVFFIGLFLSAVLYVRNHGRNVFVKTLSIAFNKKIDFIDIFYRFPFGFSLSNVKVGDSLQIEEINVQFILSSLLSKEVVVSGVEVVRPVFVVLSRNEGVILDGKENEKEDVFLNRKNFNIYNERTFYVQQLNVLDGTVEYISRNEKKSFHLNHLGLNLKGVYLPLKKIKTQCALKGIIEKEDQRVSNMNLRMKGWVDFSQRNMDGHFWIGNKENLMKVSGKAVSNNNNVTVNGSIVLSKEKEFLRESLSKKSMMENMILKGLELTDVGLQINFSFTTQIDDFKIEKILFSGNVLENQSGGTDVTDVNVLPNENVVVK